jgi:hypothetical protein
MTDAKTKKANQERRLELRKMVRRAERDGRIALEWLCQQVLRYDNLEEGSSLRDRTSDDFAWWLTFWDDRVEVAHSDLPCTLIVTYQGVSIGHFDLSTVEPVLVEVVYDLGVLVRVDDLLDELHPLLVRGWEIAAHSDAFCPA